MICSFHLQTISNYTILYKVSAYIKIVGTNMHTHTHNSFDLKNSSGRNPVSLGIALTLKQRRPKSAKVCRQC